MRTCTTFLALFSLFAGACGGGSPSPDRREFTLQGQLLSVSADHKEATIKHEQIKGFMSAMTMPYHVRDAKEFESLIAGDLINARLIVLSNDAYLEDVKKVGNAPLERSAGAAGSAAPGMELLKTGEPVPLAKFVDQEGQAFGLDAFHGSAVVLTFTYTTCPMPTMCPLMDRNFAAIQKKLQEQHNELRVRLLSVSIDPAKDTPTVMKQHAKTLGLDPKIWTFATGDPEELDRWASHFGVSVSRAANDPTDITHNLRTAILDREGNLVQTFAGNEWTPDQVLADVRVMVGID